MQIRVVSVVCSRALDRVFRKIAWQAVVNNPLSGVKDKDKNGIGDARAVKILSRAVNCW